MDLITQLTLGHQEVVDMDRQTKVVEKVAQVKPTTELVEEAMAHFHQAVTVVMAEAVEF